jgi:hypothetical protein
MALLFGRLTNSFVDFGRAASAISGESGSHNATAIQIFEEARSTFRSEAATNATYLVYIGIAIFLSTFSYIFIWVCSLRPLSCLLLTTPLFSPGPAKSIPEESASCTSSLFYVKISPTLTTLVQAKLRPVSRLILVSALAPQRTYKFLSLFSVRSHSRGDLRKSRHLRGIYRRIRHRIHPYGTD